MRGGASGGRADTPGPSVEYFTLVSPGLTEQLAAFEGLGPEMGRQEASQEVASLTGLLIIVQGLARGQGQQGRAGNGLGPTLPRQHPARWLTGRAQVARARGYQATLILIEQGAIADFAEEAQLELA